MCAEQFTEYTYIKDREVATWFYTVNTNPPDVNLLNAAERAHWLANLVSILVNALDDFAQIDSIEVATSSLGEDGLSVSSDEKEELKRVDTFLRSTLDVRNINMWLSLKCAQMGTDGILEEFLIHGNGWLSIEINVGDGDFVGSSLACVAFNLETNIYSPIAKKDNRSLAAINAPRLRNFLHRLASIPSLKFDRIDDPVGYIKAAEKYGVVDSYGFKMPDDPQAFEAILKRESANL